MRRFHDLYYHRWPAGADTAIFARINNLSWFGYELQESPLDIWIYQELLVCTHPDMVIEARGRTGGSVLFLAMVQDQIERGQVITIDSEHWKTPE